MRREPKSRRAYRALLHLYPKAHRQEYGELMVQTFDDLLGEDSSARHSIAIWLRVVGELPANITQEHIHNLEGKNMTELLKSANKRTGIMVGMVAVIVLVISLILFMDNGGTPIYSPT